MDCDHLEFHAEFAVSRLKLKESGPVTHYCADIKIRCARRDEEKVA